MIFFELQIIVEKYKKQSEETNDWDFWYIRNLYCTSAKDFSSKFHWPRPCGPLHGLPVWRKQKMTNTIYLFIDKYNIFMYWQIQYEDMKYPTK